MVIKEQLAMVIKEQEIGYGRHAKSTSTTSHPLAVLYAIKPPNEPRLPHRTDRVRRLMRQSCNCKTADDSVKL